MTKEEKLTRQRRAVAKYKANLSPERKEAIRKHQREHAQLKRINNPEHAKQLRKAYSLKNRDRLNAQRRKWSRNHPHRAWSHSTHKNHRSDGCEMGITVNELEIMARNTSYCVYCGKEILYNAGKIKNKCSPSSPSLDRINNEINITFENVRIICFQCNTTKGTRTHNGFVDYCKTIANSFN